MTSQFHGCRVTCRLRLCSCACLCWAVSPLFLLSPFVFICVAFLEYSSFRCPQIMAFMLDNTVCAVALFATHILAAIDCPDIRIPKGDSRVISCVSDRTVSEFYWYRGRTSQSSPILRLESGIKSGTEYGSEHFDIGDNGWMEMKNVRVEHESNYTLLGYYDDINFDRETFMVYVTISPSPPCPVINDCSPCKKCTIETPKDSDKLTCTITGSRPLIPLSWNITSLYGISFDKHDATERWNEEMDSWDTSLSLEYKVTNRCVVHVVQCRAEDIANITSSTIAVLEIDKEDCIDDIPATEASPTDFRLSLWVLFIVVLAIIIIILILTWYFIRQRRRIILPPHEGNPNKVENVLPLLPSKGNPNKVENVLPLLPSKGKNINKHINRESLVEALASSYGKFCSLKPLPWGEPIPITALYTEFQCMVMPVESFDSQELKKITSSDVLFLSSRFKNASRVIFIADLGYGKTTMTQQVVQRWIKEDKANLILIYIQLKDVDINKSIAEVVNDMLPGSMNATIEDIKKVLKGSKCLVLMDGLDEVSMSLEKDTSDSDDDFEIVKIDNDQETHHPEEVCDDMNIADLLKGKVASLDSKMRVWVTSREVDDMKTPFPPPHVKIKMTGFSSDQVDACIRKTCQYYCQFASESETETTDLSVEGVINLVKENLEKDDIIQEFLNTPLLLVLIIHILTARFTGAVTYLKDLKLTKLTTLIRTVITCLESRYVQKIQDNSIQSKVEKIERKLGVIAWQQRLEGLNDDRESWDKLLGTENVEIALSIGLLRLSKNISKSNVQMGKLAFTSFTGIEFYHQYFQEYLAGEYFSNEEKAIEKLEKSLENGTDDKTIRFLQFMSGSGHPSVEKFSEIFLKNKKMWNNFIDCIYETEDQEKVKSYLEDLSNKANELGQAPVINFKYLDKKYHQDAVSAFCENCNKLNVKMRSFAFREDCPFTYLTGLVLPQLQRLDLLDMFISEKDFVYILEWISRQKLPETLQFTGCTVDELSEESIEKIKTVMEGKELNIYRSKTTSQFGFMINYFNTIEGKWGNEWFPKKQ